MFLGTFLSPPCGFVLASQSSSPIMEAEWHEELRVEILISLKPHGKRVSVSQHFSRSLGIESHWAFRAHSSYQTFRKGMRMNYACRPERNAHPSWRPIFPKHRAWVCRGHPPGKAGAVTRSDNIKEGKPYYLGKKCSLSLSCPFYRSKKWGTKWFSKML